MASCPCSHWSSDHQLADVVDDELQQVQQGGLDLLLVTGHPLDARGKLLQSPGEIAHGAGILRGADLGGKCLDFAAEFGRFHDQYALTLLFQQIRDESAQFVRRSPRRQAPSGPPRRGVGRMSDFRWRRRRQRRDRCGQCVAAGSRRLATRNATEP
ncbi:MAG: hypothetical protein MZW92_52675 [Comamonadaceae bacterium]|nr:hypothetical protein [Comamonadaceae bacterium]